MREITFDWNTLDNVNAIADRIRTEMLRRAAVLAKSEGRRIATSRDVAAVLNGILREYIMDEPHPPTGLGAGD